ncbi:hypothetical protein H634G_07310 [Metarhizium anisopliae BRIP 53293]|uniref:Life-span regulatory factor domain-containing protein n=1 Tax=Metarhizium anisopliae BRIP 53293 TaxID=1291518 RepID=A0A0D9NUS7_METAN|nr:hypothetical protein H634G_07310 [Metarhizium anisopliae BRIP 53293]KJK90426.1 hypothetical protein H633G_05722 [Metarhizium anisopliae BRIP 53284]
MHHHRRKSGHAHNTSMTDVRKSMTATDPTSKHKRPGMTRRHTPVNAQKLGRSHREREREHQDAWEDERESFPQYCMTCEKQFVPHDERHLYCSETCRRVDQQNSSSHSSQIRAYSVSSNPSYYSTGNQEPRDIIPRASPSRPNSMHFSQSPPASPGTIPASHHISALSALRSLNIGPPSPPSPTGSNGGSLWPFSRSVATSPASSYRRPSGPYLSSTYDTGHHYAPGAYTYDSGSHGLDRPLPTRHPGAYSRPKSIELVTPVLGR